MRSGHSYYYLLADLSGYAADGEHEMTISKIFNYSTFLNMVILFLFFMSLGTYIGAILPTNILPSIDTPIKMMSLGLAFGLVTAFIIIGIGIDREWQIVVGEH